MEKEADEVGSSYIHATGEDLRTFVRLGRECHLQDLDFVADVLSAILNQRNQTRADEFIVPWRFFAHRGIPMRFQRGNFSCVADKRKLSRCLSFLESQAVIKNFDVDHRPSGGVRIVLDSSVRQRKFVKSSKPVTVSVEDVAAAKEFFEDGELTL